ncbi:MAG: hypothetical protein KF803_13450 [Cyclobacteriaceae bacterium]|nr:hypothetical protein [Cyclobacteriaceae bacterium]
MEGINRPIHVTAYVESQLAHTSQLFSGLAMLQDAGKIKVTYKAGKELRADEPLVRLEVNNKVLVFDLSDNPALYSNTWLQRSDLYFKRMLTTTLQQTDSRLQPYGLNYPVFHEHDRMVYRAWLTKNRKRWMHALLRSNSFLSKALNINLSYANNLVHHFEDTPRTVEDPRIIFYARLWNPDSAKQEWKREERIIMNQMRVDLVLRLRKEFGDLFIGGIQRDRLSAQLAPDALVKSDDEVFKGNYLKKLRRASIGIATPGLEGSVGFKLAEYVAMSKAVVTTPVNCIVPGNFAVNQHYLTYATAEQCVEQCVKLVNDRELREKLMVNNNIYYTSHLRPDLLLLKCLEKV